MDQNGDWFLKPQCRKEEKREVEILVMFEDLAFPRGNHETFRHLSNDIQNKILHFL